MPVNSGYPGSITRIRSSSRRYNRPMAILMLGLLLFFGIHSISIVAPATRDRWAASLGANAWRGLYSLLSLAGFVLLIYGYRAARHSPELLYIPPHWMHPITLLVMLPVFPLLLASGLPGRIKAAVGHPMLTAVMLWSFAHLLVNGRLADVLLFGGFLLWSVADRLSFLRRIERSLKTAPPGRWNDLIAVAVGLGIHAAVLLWLHALIFGVKPA
jgi:uncharacterized membrane protein